MSTARTTPSSKEERLAKALRENLQRRKAAAPAPVTKKTPPPHDTEA
jgi:hypothetical protein